MHFLRRSLIGLFLLSVTVALVAVAGNAVYSAIEARRSADGVDRPARERVFAVNVTAIEIGELTPEIRSFGEVQSRRTLEIRASAAGEIVWLSEQFEEGARVAAGDLLARIDDRDAQGRLDTARADLTEAEGDLRDARRSLELAESELQSAQDQTELQRRALLRQRDLLDRGVGTEAAVETAELAVAAAEQAVLSRRQALAQAETRLDQGATTLERRRIALAEARRRLADTKIAAQFDGVLSGVDVVQGGLVSANERLADLIDPDALEVSFRVSAGQYADLLDAAGQLIPANITVALEVSGADLITTGQITRDSPAVGEGQTGRLVFATLDAGAGLRPGDFVTVRVTEPPLPNVALLPAAAVDAGGQVLVLAEDDRLEVASVTVLRRQGDDVIVRAPDLGGREAVSQRTPFLGAGIKVRPLRPEPRESEDDLDLVELDDTRRARLVAFVEASESMPAEAKERVLAQLQQPRVSVRMVERIESRMGG